MKIDINKLRVRRYRIVANSKEFATFIINSSLLFTYGIAYLSDVPIQ
jgi:hypothetical protein